MDWTDYYMENLLSENNVSEEKQKGFSAITSLWLQYAQFEIALHQYKKAVDVFDQATNDPIVTKSGKIYLAYANFCVERKKLSNAQKVYLKGLSAGLSDEDNVLMWDNFLLLMHKINKSQELTMAQLFAAVVKQLGDKGAGLAPPVSAIASLEVNPVVVKEESMDVHVLPALPDLSVNESKEAETAVPAGAAADAPVDILAAVPDVASVDNLQQFAAPDDLDSVQGMAPEQVVRTYDRRPPMVFSASNKVLPFKATLPFVR